MIFEPQTCYSKLICALERLFRRVQVRDACFPNLNFASLLCLATARRKLLPLIRIADDALTGPSCSRGLPAQFEVAARAAALTFGMLSLVRDR